MLLSLHWLSNVLAYLHTTQYTSHVLHTLSDNSQQLASMTFQLSLQQALLLHRPLLTFILSMHGWVVRRSWSAWLVVYPVHWIRLSFVRLCFRTDWLSNDYVRNSLSTFTRFCMQNGNVVSSTPIVYGVNQK